MIEKIDINEMQTSIFEETGKNVIVNEPYIAYLNVYNQNVNAFSKPVSIDVAVNDQIFSTLFGKFIDLETTPKTNIRKNILIVKTEFLPRVKPYYTIEKELSTSDYPNLVLPVTIESYAKEHGVVPV